MSDIVTLQYRPALLQRAVLFLEALGQQPAVRDGVGDRMTYDRKARLKTKGRGSVGAKCLVSIRI